MRLALGALYSEVGTSFEISHLVFRQIRAALDKHVMIPLDLFPEQGGRWLSLLVSTRRALHKVEVKGPDIDRRNKCVTWGLWLPYHEVVNSADPIESFVEKCFEAAGQVLVPYGATKEAIQQAECEVKREVLNNERYIYAGEKVLPPDLSDILRKHNLPSPNQ